MRFFIFDIFNRKVLKKLEIIIITANFYRKKNQSTLLKNREEIV